ncbi:hypothetical protein LAZ67_X004056 [Cordylochernes scorpioides]|uniref:Uncharacterized protein n=1 Tax=Cordylochernes scorpioides TaxID=51811 RepID=A0ABY6LVL8_9ARAC|nr:hypothetical protein LAZ67_X004056 [Cordylochernes scorpioides]
MACTNSALLISTIKSGHLNLNVVACHLKMTHMKDSQNCDHTRNYQKGAQYCPCEYRKKGYETSCSKNYECENCTRSKANAQMTFAAIFGPIQEGSDPFCEAICHQG